MLPLSEKELRRSLIRERSKLRKQLEETQDSVDEAIKVLERENSDLVSKLLKTGKFEQVKEKKFEVTKEDKELFRKLAPGLHPDLNMDAEDQEEKEELFKDLVNAYENGDTEELKNIESDMKGEAEVIEIIDAQVRKLHEDYNTLLRHPSYRLWVLYSEIETRAIAIQEHRKIVQNLVDNQGNVVG